MPPRHGKSELCAVRFPAWFLGRNPDKRFILASYASDLAERFSRQVRSVVDSDTYLPIFPGVGMDPVSRSVSAWDLYGRRGGMKAVGVGGPITGHGAHVLLIDDPIKNREEAESLVMRESVWNWYTSTAYTRLEDNGAVIVVMTRWQEDDLAGRLLEAQRVHARSDQWHVLHMPAINEQGEALWPAKYSADDLERIRVNIGSYDWSALYMGAPAPPEGALVKRAWIQIRPSAPDGMRKCRYWDKAGTVMAGDYTAGVKIGRTTDGSWWICHATRGQWGPGEREARMRSTAEADGIETLQRIEQEPGSGGKDSASISVRNLAGFDVQARPVSGDKETRFRPFAAQAEAGNVYMVAGEWNAAYLDEICSFPFGKHDDQVDGTGGAFNELAVGATWDMW